MFIQTSVNSFDKILVIHYKNKQLLRYAFITNYNKVSLLVKYWV